MRPKVDGAVHLHELTAGLGLSEFVLFSSAAGLLVARGRAIMRRRTRSWTRSRRPPRAGSRGPVTRVGAVGAAERDDGDPWAARARTTRAPGGCFRSLSGVELFDLARGMDEALVVPVRFDFGGAGRAGEHGDAAGVLERDGAPQDAPGARSVRVCWRASWRGARE